MHGGSPLQQAETHWQQQKYGKNVLKVLGGHRSKQRGQAPQSGVHMQVWTDLQRACPDALWAVVGGVVGCAIQQEGDVQPRQVPIVSPAGQDEGVCLVLWDCCSGVRRAIVRTGGAASIGCMFKQPSAGQVCARPHRQGPALQMRTGNKGTWVTWEHLV